MPLSTRIAPHLPYLRRFARALTGSQKDGDACVAATLEALIANVQLFPNTSSDRTGLYRLFCDLYNDLDANGPVPASEHGWEKHSAANLARLAPRARQAFLLVAVEDFSNQDAAEVLNVSEQAFLAFLKEASTDISRQVATSILIIEDEPLIAMDIEQIAESLGHQVVGIARTKDEAVQLFGEHKPHMVLADIQLADGSSGIDAVNEILDNSSIPVIFITAFPEQLLTGKRPEPTYLVSKPFNSDMVRALISQALFFNEVSQRAR